MNKRIILVANRLPITVSKGPRNFQITPSVGGLATGMSSIAKNNECVWVGFTGVPSDQVPEKTLEEIEQKIKKENNCFAIRMSTKEVDQFYEGFCNSTIWPLFHYFQFLTKYHNETWEMYQKINLRFYQKISELIREDDVVWIHDYQLMLLPEIIRKNHPNVRIGFFLHIPFPSYEIFRLLPWRSEILQGLLGADLIGFHTFNYMRHFLSSSLRLLGKEDDFGKINLGDRVVKADVFPMGIDYDRYSNYLDTDVRKEIEILKTTFKDQKIIISVDRLDYTKGIIQRLEAYELFLKKYPEHIGKVVLIMVAVPSRTNVESYKKLKKQVNEIVGSINGKYSTLNWQPLRYIYRAIPFKQMMALYSQASVALVSPIRDGMNLVAKEFIASRTNSDGVLILSEMAGVAEEILEAIIINPNNYVEVAEGIQQALFMDVNEQKIRMRAMQNRIKKNDVFNWAQNFINALEVDTVVEKMSSLQYLSRRHEAELIGHIKKVTNTLMVFDLDNTLIPIRDRIDLAIPDERLIYLLNNLSRKNNLQIYIVSGRNKDYLDKWFSGLNIGLAAEHGAWFKRISGEWQKMSSLDNVEWKKEIGRILDIYVERTPGTFIEEKEFSLVWHYRRANQVFASMRLKELRENLFNVISNKSLMLMEGSKVLEIKDQSVSKGKILANLLSEEQKYDCIMVAGDDRTDEDMFAVLPPEAYSIKIGLENSKARFFTPSYTGIRHLLEEINLNLLNTEGE